MWSTTKTDAGDIIDEAVYETMNRCIDSRRAWTKIVHSWACLQTCCKENTYRRP